MGSEKQMIIKKVKEIYTHEGLNGIINRIRNRIYIKFYVYKVKINDNDKFSESEFKLINMNIDILNRMYLEYKDEISERKYMILKERLTKNSSEKGYVVVDKSNNIYGYYHIAYGAYFDAGMNYSFLYDPCNVHFFDDYTFKNRRRKGAHKFSIRARLNLVKKLGYKTATVHIRAQNEYSRKSYESFGFSIIKEIRHYKIWPIRKLYERDL